MMLPIAAVLFALGYVMQMVLINPFIARPEHSQFMLMVAVAIIIVNSLLIDLRSRRAAACRRPMPSTASPSAR